MTARRAVSVLAVDDNPDHLFLMERRLRDAGVHVTTASSAAEALELLPRADLVLLDYRLPGVDGLELLRSIRATDGPSVVRVAGMGSEGVAVEAMRSGAIDYVVKNPGYLDALPQIIERAWRQHDLTRRARELERIALLVTSATERADVLSEILRGARRLLEAEACGLFVATEAGVRLEASEGAETAGLESLDPDAERVLGGPEDLDVVAGGSTLLVRLPSLEGERLGVLAMIGERDPAYAPEEVRLARTFASFAGVALDRVRRHEFDQTMVAELQRMLDLRSIVVASISHELRTPLTCITGFTDTLLDRWAQLPDEDRLDFIEKIHRHTGELNGLVEGLLDFSALEAGRMSVELKEIDLRAEIDATLTGLNPMLNGRPVEVDVQPATVQGDPSLLRRVLTNLISNAVKYSDPGAPVFVRSVREARTVRVEVSDRGVGMSPDEASRVFEPFWRGRDATANAMRGSGIGLALVKEYMRVMGGRVGVSSEPGRGSTFWFSLRTTDAPRPGERPSLSVVEGSEQPHG